MQQASKTVSSASRESRGVEIRARPACPRLIMEKRARYGFDMETLPPPPPPEAAEEAGAIDDVEFSASPRCIAKTLSAKEVLLTTAHSFQFPEASAPPCPDPLLSVEGRRVLALDNDETTGYYQLASLLYAMHMHLVKRPPPEAVTVDFLRRGAGRPGTAQLLRQAAALKASGRLDHVVLFTAAKNESGWVTYLAGCLEAFAEVPAGTVERVVAREDVGPLSFCPRTGHLVKDLRLLCTDPSRVLLVDDKPHFVHSGGCGRGVCVGVTPYEQHVGIEDLVEAIPCGPAGVALARAALAEDRASNKPPSPRDFSSDTELFAVAAAVNAFFP